MVAPRGRFAWGFCRGCQIQFYYLGLRQLVAPALPVVLFVVCHTKDPKHSQIGYILKIILHLSFFIHQVSFPFISAYMEINCEIQPVRFKQLILNLFFMRLVVWFSHLNSNWGSTMTGSLLFLLYFSSFDGRCRWWRVRIRGEVVQLKISGSHSVSPCGASLRVSFRVLSVVSLEETVLWTHLNESWW